MQLDISVVMLNNNNHLSSYKKNIIKKRKIWKNNTKPHEQKRYIDKLYLFIKNSKNKLYV